MHSLPPHTKAPGRAQHTFSLAAAVVLSLGAMACTPALNWRDVAIDRLTVNLPCKPDRAQRPVQLGKTPLTLDMAGCEAAGGLFAVSHTRVPDASSIPEVLSAWRASTLENMQVANPTEVMAAYQATVAAKPPSSIAQVQPLQVSGKNPQGAAVQARLVWFVSASDIYHLAVYASDIKQDMVEPLITQARIR